MRLSFPSLNRASSEQGGVRRTWACSRRVGGGRYRETPKHVPVAANGGADAEQVVCIANDSGQQCPNPSMPRPERAATERLGSDSPGLLATQRAEVVSALSGHLNAKKLSTAA